MSSFSTDTFDPQSNRGTWAESVQVTDESGSAVDISDATEIEIQVRDPDCLSDLKLSATLTGGGITRGSDTGVFSWSFSKTDMSALCAKTYSVGVNVTVNGEDITVLIARLPIYEGVVQ